MLLVRALLSLGIQNAVSDVFFVQRGLNLVAKFVRKNPQCFGQSYCWTLYELALPKQTPGLRCESCGSTGHGAFEGWGPSSVTA